MKDKKFVVLCILGLIWLLIFVATCFGEKINPRVELAVIFLCISWFAYWTLSIIFGKDKSTSTPKTNANTTKTKKSTDSKNSTNG